MAGSKATMDLLSSDSEEERPLRAKKQKKSRAVPYGANADSNELQINEKFATKFEQRERFKDLARAKELLRDGDLDEDDSESDESEDEDAELLSSNLDLKILQTINSLKKKDPKIYDPNTKFFSDNEDDDESDDDDDDDDDEVDKIKQPKKQTFKDVLREQLQADDNGDFNSDDDNEYPHAKLASKRSKSQLLYDNEQEKIRQQFLSAAQQHKTDSEDEDLLLVKSKSAAEIADDERAIQAELEEMRRLETNEDHNNTEKVDFLQQYLSKKLWKEPKLTKRTPVNDNEDDLEEDEEAVEEAERFESKYNFRFEEIAAEQNQFSSAYDTASRMIMQQSSSQVLGHARTVEGSLRRVDDKRKLQRETRKEQKEKEKRQKENELRRLKNLKKEELKERLQKIGEISGLKNLGLIDEGVLDEEWDPDKHEQMMQGEFGDDYYNEDDDGMLLGDGEEDERYNVLPDDDEMLVDDNYNYEQPEAIDEEAAKASISQLMGEYYALDYEDVIAGIPCRFKYTPVEAEDFGLTAEEILMADDNELNQFVSLKSIAPYRRKSSKDKTEKEIAKKRKRLRQALKAASSASASGDVRAVREEEGVEAQPPQEQVTSTEVVEEGGHKRKRRKRKHREGEADATGEPAKIAADDKADHVEVTSEMSQTPGPIPAPDATAVPADGQQQVKSPDQQKQKFKGLPKTRRQDRERKEKKKEKKEKKPEKQNEHLQEVHGREKAERDKRKSKYGGKGNKDKRKQEASPEQRRMSLYK